MRRRALSLALRSLLWTILLPGMVAGYIPWRFYGLAHIPLDATNPLTILALLLMAAGVALLIACVWEFAARGKGTLSPADPPKELVGQGLYRYVAAVRRVLRALPATRGALAAANMTFGAPPLAIGPKAANVWAQPSPRS